MRERPWAVGVEHKPSGRFNIHTRYADETRAREVAAHEATDTAGIEVRYLPVVHGSFEDEAERLARFMSDELVGDFVFDGNDHGDAPQEYVTNATAILRFVRRLGWREPPRQAAQ